MKSFTLAVAALVAIAVSFGSTGYAASGEGGYTRAATYRCPVGTVVTRKPTVPRPVYRCPVGTGTRKPSAPRVKYYL